jgi:hypothetical protein
MSPTVFWILFSAPAVFLVVLRLARQGRGYRLAYLGPPRVQSPFVCPCLRVVRIDCLEGLVLIGFK